MRESQRKEEAKYVYMTTVVLILLIGFCLRLFFGPLLFPITDVVAWSIGGIFLLISSIISYQWHKLKGKIYEGKLVTEGIYAYIRHPHYSSIILMIFGISFLLQSLLVFLFAILNVIILNQAAKEEEGYLIKKHGAIYEEYMRKVRWRFIPLVI
ncbi:MAG: isoprenylcysteine carboxylmethyltransferase family protein [Aigarchaeota archaeon]|nr:isoprenylcysteine carboxylmethyltransferase family protein [Candidatus Wolframiiraptor gerlachensis]